MTKICKKPRRRGSPPSPVPVTEFTEDRISALPDDLVQTIMSSLELKEVVATSILSKRWRPVWTQVPVLDLGTWGPGANERIPKSITMSLLLYEGSKIRKFRAEFKDLQDRYVNEWILFAVHRDVEEFDLSFCSGIEFWDYTNSGKSPKQYAALKSLFECGSIEVLKLASWELRLESALSLRSLKKLELEHVWLTDLDTSQCPLLEVLILRECNTIGRLNIHAPNPKLRSLEIDDIYEVIGYDSTLTLCAPNVLSVQFSGFLRSAYIIQDLSSVRSVNIDFCRFYDFEYELDVTYSLLDLLVQVKHASTLIFNQWCIRVVSSWEENEVKLPSFKATYLELESDLKESELLGMATILSSTLGLESLTFDIRYGEPPPESWRLTVDCRFAELMGSLGNSLSTIQRLKSVKICLRSKYFWLNAEPERNLSRNKFLAKWQMEIKLVQLILKSCRVLEKMIVSTMKMHSWPLKSELHLGLLRRLRSFPRASVDADICFF